MCLAYRGFCACWCTLVGHSSIISDTLSDFFITCWFVLCIIDWCQSVRISCSNCALALIVLLASVAVWNRHKLAITMVALAVPAQGAVSVKSKSPDTWRQ